MDRLLELMIESSIVLAFLLLTYYIIRHSLSEAHRRWTLLFLPLVSFGTISLKYLLLQFGTTYTIPVIELQPVVVQEELVAHDLIEFFTLSNVYLTGIFVVIASLLIKVIRILFFFRDGIVSSDRIRIKRTSYKESFSFFNLIHLSADLDEVEKNVVLDHELVHYKKRHSLDLIIMELYQALFWFNPLLLLMKKELVDVHEFEVDRKMYNKYQADYWHFLLRYSLGSSSTQFLLTSQFFTKRTLAKRIKKMKNKSKTKVQLILLIPIVAATFSFVSWTSIDYSPQLSQGHYYYGDGKIYDNVDKMPEFKGGQEALFAFIGENVTYPETAKSKEVEGTVYTEFIIDTDGSVTEPSIKRGTNPDLDAEALRVIKIMPAWTPGENRGKKVKVRMILPINFKLN